MTRTSANWTAGGQDVAGEEGGVVAQRLRYPAEVDVRVRDPQKFGLRTGEVAEGEPVPEHRAVVAQMPAAGAASLTVASGDVKGAADPITA